MEKRTRTLLLLLALLLTTPAYSRSAQASSTQTPAPIPAAQTARNAKPAARDQTDKAGKNGDEPRRYETVPFESRLVGAPLWAAGDPPARVRQAPPPPRLGPRRERRAPRQRHLPHRARDAART